MEKEHHVFIYGVKNEDGTVVVEGCVSRGIDSETADSNLFRNGNALLLMHSTNRMQRHMRSLPTKQPI